MYITQGLKRAVQTNGSGIATVDGERQRTWVELAERASRLAGGLKELGLSEGGRVAILALNGDRYLEYFFAIPWAGGVVVPLNIRFSPQELTYMLNDYTLQGADWGVQMPEQCRNSSGTIAS